MRLGAVTKGLRVLFVVRMTHAASQWEKKCILFGFGVVSHHIAISHYNGTLNSTGGPVMEDPMI